MFDTRSPVPDYYISPLDIEDEVSRFAGPRLRAEARAALAQDRLEEQRAEDARVASLIRQYGRPAVHVVDDVDDEFGDDEPAADWLQGDEV